jgi:16S rRNA (guanine1207-N2)-methyltransferase
MALHTSAAVLRPGGGLLLFGANDEGIKSVAKRLTPLFADVRTVATGGHCRVLFAVLNSAEVQVRGSLEEWMTTFAPGMAELPDRWISYPGVFAHGSVDSGTRMLIEALPEDMSGLHVLDFGCGTGLIGAVCAARGASVDLLDVDTLALEAARQNLPSAGVFAGDGLDAVSAQTYDLIVSNPPIHSGKGETHEVLERLIRGAPGRLVSKGVFFIVVQKRVKVEPWFEATFRSFERVASSAVFNVFRSQRSQRS